MPLISPTVYRVIFPNMHAGHEEYMRARIFEVLAKESYSLGLTVERVTAKAESGRALARNRKKRGSDNHA